MRTTQDSTARPPSRRRLAVLCAAAALAGCASARSSWSIDTTYTAALSTSPAGGPLACEAGQTQTYGISRTVTRNLGGSFTELSTVERPWPLAVAIRNTTDQVVTVDWEHSAFVDGTGTSHRLALYEADPRGGGALAGPDAPGPGPRAVEKPAVPVIAPGTRIEASVLPARSLDRPAMFFMPFPGKPASPFKLIISVSGAPVRLVECLVTPSLVSAVDTRRSTAPWPGNGQACVPFLGCAGDLPCVDGKCLDPSAPPPRSRSEFRGPCDTDADCVKGLHCTPFKECVY